MTVAVLFARQDSYYKTLPGCDVYDIDRDARTWPGGCPVVAHPPCRAWGLLRQFAKPREDEKALAPWAVAQERECGGVLEHPNGSTLWPELGLPEPGRCDEFGGWTLVIHQHWFGHRAQKATRLYICGVEPWEIPEMPMKLGNATHCIRPTKSYPRLPSVTKPEREHTPPALAEWLVELASRCKANSMTLRCARCNRTIATPYMTIGTSQFGPKCSAQMGLSVAKPKRTRVIHRTVYTQPDPNQLALPLEAST